MEDSAIDGRSWLGTPVTMRRVLKLVCRVAPPERVSELSDLETELAKLGVE
jgi:hypothetical protein